jgi:hypothetical protein
MKRLHPAFFWGGLIVYFASFFLVAVNDSIQEANLLGALLAHT